MAGIFIELYRDDETPIYLNVDNIETMGRIEFQVQGTSYTRIRMVSGDTFHVIEKPEKILGLIKKEKIEERKDNTICLV